MADGGPRTMARKSPEEKAVARKANFEKRVAQTAARDAARRAEAESALRREQAEHSANVAATARTFAEQGRLSHFPHLESRFLMEQFTYQVEAHCGRSAHLWVQ